MRHTYFDYCANTPVDIRVISAYSDAVIQYPGNANSQHAMGRRSLERIQEATKNIADMLQVSPDEIIYTSGATEANNLAIKGIVEANKHVGKHIISTALEHTTVSASLTALQMSGYEIDLIPVGKDGKIDLEELEFCLRNDTCLVSVSVVDSEVGVQQPITELAEILKAYPQCKLHIDATQAMGKIPVDFTYGDTISFAPHKFFGLNGAGVLVKKKGVNLVPQISGGQSLTLYRSGTPDTAMVVAIEAALQYMYETLEQDYQYVEDLYAYFAKQLNTIDGLVLNHTQDSIPHIVNVSVNGIKGAQMQHLLDEKGYCVSVKSACSTNALPSKAVFALTSNRKRALESFRISLSKMTTKSEIDGLVEAIKEIVMEKDNG